MASFSAMRLRALALLLAFSACGGDDDVFFDAGEVDARAPFDGGLDAPVAPLDAGDGDADVDAGIEPDLCAMEDRDADPRRVFFLGNSFTFTYDLPGLFRQLASAGGFTPPIVDSYTVGGQTLQGHRADSAANAGPARIPEGWDVVILQELSTRPTDAIGPAEQFKVDATYFHDLARDANPDGRVILYETFARRAGHALYPATFADPEDMQAQLRFHYDDAADEYIPRFTESVVPPNVEVARVGDAWEAQLALGEPPRLHGSDDYHPSRAGAYLSALVFVGTVYGRSTIGLPAIGVDDATALALQESADLVTGATRPVPSIACPAGIEVGDALSLSLSTHLRGWPALARRARGQLRSAARLDRHADDRTCPHGRFHGQYKPAALPKTRSAFLRRSPATRDLLEARWPWATVERLSRGVVARRERVRGRGAARSRRRSGRSRRRAPAARARRSMWKARRRRMARRTRRLARAWRSALGAWRRPRRRPTRASDGTSARGLATTLRPTRSRPRGPRRELGTCARARTPRRLLAAFAPKKSSKKAWLRRRTATTG
ncbi:MAG: hypothetical protein R3B99_18165 [Polyangiales bacterium]